MGRYISLAKDRKRISTSGIGDWFRGVELILLVAVVVILFDGMRRLENSLSSPPGGPSFTEIEARIESSEIVALNEVERKEQLLPALDAIDNEAERQYAAGLIFRYVQDLKGRVANIGSLNGSLLVERAELEELPDSSLFRRALQERDEADERLRRREGGSPSGGGWRQLRGSLQQLLGAEVSATTKVAPFLGTGLISQIKPALVARRPSQFRNSFWVCFWLLIGGLFVVHLLWSVSGFIGDQFLLPTSGLLCGIGFLIIAGMRDPLRDTPGFSEYVIGVLAGLCGLLVASLSDRLPVIRTAKVWFKSRPIIPLGLAIGLSSLLLIFGSAPGGSDARVNLGPFQPVEVIRLLVVFYLAAYFDRHWEFLRHLNQSSQGFFRLLSRLGAPRLVFFIPVVVAMVVVLIFFFLQKDLGPALVLGLVFLSLYGVARGRYLLIAGGVLIVLSGLILSFYIGEPWTVVKRIHIFLDVWNNGLRGGDQIAHSLWALSTGGLLGTGPGLGDTGTIPAGHTDLIISSIGEEFGWVAVVGVLTLYSILTFRSLRATLRSENDYDLFLGLGLTLVTGWQILLITTGILGLFPLSGVVSPFLSWGKSSMIANFINLGLLGSISARGTTRPRTEHFVGPIRRLGLVMGLLILVVMVRAGYVQVARGDDYVLRGVLVELADGSFAYQYNQRLLSAARIMKTGTIYDRNGIPLATSDCAVLRQNSGVLTELGADPEKLCRQTESRIYPFGAKLFHLLGDLNTRVNWGAPATIYIEREYYSRLRGFDDRSVRVPLKVVRSVNASRGEPGGTDELAGPDQIVVIRQSSDDESLEEAGLDSIDGESTRSSVALTVVKRDYSEILPLLRHRHEPDHPAVQAILNRERNVRLAVDLRLQLRSAEILSERLRDAKVKRGAVVVIDPPSGDILAAVSYPWPGEPFTPNPAPPGMPENPREELVDRAFAALRPPGSTFKIVTALAALRLDGSRLEGQQFECRNQANGRVGMRIPGFRRAVLDATGDRAHGNPDMDEAIVRSCNAYFAQLGLKIGPRQLLETADQLGIRVAVRDAKRSPVEVLAEGENLLQAGYGQGQVVVTPFQMARVAAVVANGGRMEQGRWVIDDSNRRTEPGVQMISPERSQFLIGSMRGVVTRGTASNASASTMAGKTGTAQVKSRLRYLSGEKVGFRDERGNIRYLEWKRGDPTPAGLRPAFYEQPQVAHGWFIGLAPYDSKHPIAFSVLMENGGSGRGAAVPVADRIVSEALKIGFGK